MPISLLNNLRTEGISLFNLCVCVVCVMYSAQLDQEMSKDESIIDKNESPQHQFQTP